MREAIRFCRKPTDVPTDVERVFFFLIIQNILKVRQVHSMLKQSPRSPSFVTNEKLPGTLLTLSSVRYTKPVERKLFQLITGWINTDD